MTDRFKASIQRAFQYYWPTKPLISNALYGIVYYFHKTTTQLDADNISKPIWDALEGLLYEDDAIIKLRYAGIFDLRLHDLEIIDLTNMPENVATDFLERLNDSDHLIYVEIGNLNYTMFKFGCE